MESESRPKKKKKNILSSVSGRWVITITLVSFVLSVVMSYVSSEALSHVGNLLAFVILLAFILLGILFDMIGVAATAATERSFHAMAAKKINGARQAVWITRNAEKVGSFCNDVVGDISGIISGATSAIIVTHISQNLDNMLSVVVSLVITGMVAALTIGGKALGKGIGIGCCEQIVFGVGKVLSILPIKLK